MYQTPGRSPPLFVDPKLNLHFPNLNFPISPKFSANQICMPVFGGTNHTMACKPVIYPTENGRYASQQFSFNHSSLSEGANIQPADPEACTKSKCRVSEAKGPRKKGEPTRPCIVCWRKEQIQPRTLLTNSASPERISNKDTNDCRWAHQPAIVRFLFCKLWKDKYFMNTSPTHSNWTDCSALLKKDSKR